MSDTSPFNIQTMDERSKKLAGILLIILPTVAYGGVSLLSLLINDQSGYADNKLRQDLWRAGHAHAGVLLILSLVILKYVDEAKLSDKWKSFVRNGTPVSAILISAAFFTSVMHPAAREPNALINLAYVGFGLLVVTLISLGIGLLRK
jgi:hypothetical protein